MSKRGTDKSTDLLCSFCGKSQSEVKKLIAGPGVYICDECIELCNDIIAEEYEKEEAKHSRVSIPEPAAIKEETKATIRCILEEEPAGSTCIYSGKSARHMVILARAY